MAARWTRRECGPPRCGISARSGDATRVDTLPFREWHYPEPAESFALEQPQSEKRILGVVALSRTARDSDAVVGCRPSRCSSRDASLLCSFVPGLSSEHCRGYPIL